MSEKRTTISKYCCSQLLGSEFYPKNMLQHEPKASIVKAWLRMRSHFEQRKTLLISSPEVPKYVSNLNNWSNNNK